MLELWAMEKSPVPPVNMRVAVIGSGVSGLAAARTLARAGARVVLYEKDDRVGGHAYTLHADGVALDVGFMVFNSVTYPNMLKYFGDLGVEIEASDMSFSVSLDDGKGWEWGSSSLGGVFAQKKNLINPSFYKMISEIVVFKKDVLEYLKGLEDSNSDADETLGHFLQSRGYSDQFRDCYFAMHLRSTTSRFYRYFSLSICKLVETAFLDEMRWPVRQLYYDFNVHVGQIPVCASIWSCSSDTVLNFSAASILTFCRNHHLLQIFGRPQWMTVRDRSVTYVTKVVEELEAANAEIRINSEVTHIRTLDNGKIEVEVGSQIVDYFDECVVAAHAPDALEMRGEDATHEERTVLGAFQYASSDIYVHRDANLMPKSKTAWSAWNFLGDINGRVCVTYWLNILQNLGNTGLPFLVTLNPPKVPKSVFKLWKTSHPIPSLAAATASRRLDSIQGHHKIWYCGAYQGYGFHEDGLKAGLEVGEKLLGRKFESLKLNSLMILSWSQLGTRMVVASFLKNFVRTGNLEFLESGGTVLKFKGEEKGCDLRCVLYIHNPAFYWKVATRADMGVADSYIDGDFSFQDKKHGLLHFLQLLIANRDLQQTEQKNHRMRGWWNPALFTAVVGQAFYYFKHSGRTNTLTNSRRNISQHYDLSNEMFALYLDETMTYSCAIFKKPTDTLKDAQLRKLNQIIDKAKIDSDHEVLEIGCGWGSMAVEIVRRTGCRYTGISLSREQLKYAEKVVRAAGLKDKITFLYCDYRSVPGRHKFDRIVSCEMLEAVGHEYLSEFFQRCDHLLAKDGLVVVQVCSTPDPRYEEYRRSSDFIKKYIFPGSCLPSLSALTAAMAAGSSLCVEHMENIGSHYYPTLMRWRENFLSKQSEIKSLGFDDKFIRTWDYYFVYCAAGYKTCTLGNLQLVFSRTGNEVNLGTPYGIV